MTNCYQLALGAANTINRAEFTGSTAATLATATRVTEPARRHMRVLLNNAGYMAQEKTGAAKDSVFLLANVWYDLGSCDPGVTYFYSGTANTQLHVILD